MPRNRRDHELASLPKLSLLRISIFVPFTTTILIIVALLLSTTFITMSNAEDIFHLFPQLPLELREEIWRCCLPRRVCEIDEPNAQIVFDVDFAFDDDEPAATPCKCFDTTVKNGRPPLISRVCRESRAVALENGNIAQVSGRRPRDAEWTSGTNRRGYWEDRVRDSAHMNWNARYEFDYSTVGNPLHALAWEALHLSGNASLMLQFLDGSPRPYPDEEVAPIGDSPARTMPFNAINIRIDERQAKLRDLRALRQLQKWLVVMRTVVVHCDLRTAAATGLFGLLGDAQVQIMDVAEEERIRVLLDLAESCERNETVTIRQDFRPPAVDTMRKQVQDIVTELGYGEMHTTMQPAIMFRLCTQMCNRLDRCTVPKAQRQGPIGRGRGIGRGLAVPEAQHQGPVGRGRGFGRGCGAA